MTPWFAAECLCVYFHFCDIQCTKSILCSAFLSLWLLF